MTLDWQNTLALALVAAAAVYLTRQGWLVLRRKKSGGCGCAKCPAKGSAPSATILPVESLTRK